jgi:DNA polymerase-3 subunit gamma/tau
VAITEGGAFDVIEIDAASNRGINEIRELRDRVQFAPSQFRKKVYIIDEVHMLTSEAFNALLKTLEEPPEYVVFVLATTELHKVPATILSRCQRYEFRRMTAPVIAKRLAEVAKREKIGLTESAARRIAHLADGALRDALVMLEQARGFATGTSIDDAVLDEAFGESHRDLIERLIDAIIASDPGKALQTVADATQQGVDAAWLAKELLRWFRLALLARTSRDVLDVEAPPDEAESIAARAESLGRAKIMTALRLLSDCVAQRWSTQPRIDLELALARIIIPSDELTVQGLTDRVRALEERSGGGNASPPASPAPTPATQSRTTQSRKMQSRALEPGESVHNGSAEDPAPTVSMAPAKAGSLTATKLVAMWHLVMSAVRERSNTAFAYLQHATIVDASDEMVTLSVAKKHFLESLSEPGMTALVADAIEHVSGMRPRIALVLGAAPERAAKAADPSGFALAESVLGTELL